MDTKQVGRRAFWRFFLITVVPFAFVGGVLTGALNTPGGVIYLAMSVGYAVLLLYLWPRYLNRFYPNLVILSMVKYLRDKGYAVHEPSSQDDVP
jgi:hypothetical protein